MPACLHCNKEFVKKANVQKYCSADCRDSATSTKGPLRVATCRGCSKKFETTHPGKEFCEKECRWTYFNNNRETSRAMFRDCVVCGKSFQPMQKTGPGRQWCSETCKHVMNGNPERLKKASGTPEDIEKARDYRRKFSLKRNFGISLDAYNAMLSDQGGACAICKRPETAKNNFDKVTRRLAVDHCHTKGHVRKLLCTKCNLMLGGAEDNLETLQNAIEYLKSHQEE